MSDRLIAEKQIALALPAPADWTRAKGKNACSRDPAKGPGSCWHWWDGCPRAEKRGCYRLWQQRKAEEAAAHA